MSFHSSRSFPFSTEQSLIVGYTTVFTYLHPEGHPGACGSALVIMKRAAVDIHLEFSCGHTFSALGKYQGA